MKKPEDEWISVGEAARRLNLDEKSLYRILAQNRLGAKAVVRIGRTIRVNYRSIKAGAAEGSQPPAETHEAK
jgi:excisionase family DNA binding protein